MIGIYAIINKISGKIYIGSSKNLHQRKYHHFSDLKNNKHCNEYLQRSFNKHGKENFEFKIIKYCKEDKLKEKEQYYINYYNSTNRKCGYNLEIKVDRQIISEGTREKLRQINLGRKFSEEHKEKLRLSHLGKKHSDRSKRKIGMKNKNKRKGIKLSEDIIKKMSVSHTKYSKYKEEIKILHKKGMKVSEIANKFGCTYCTVYKYLRNEKQRKTKTFL